MAPVAERDELTKVQRVGVAGEPAVAAEEPGQRHVLRIDQVRVVDDDAVDGMVVIGMPPESMGLGRRGHPAPHG